MQFNKYFWTLYKESSEGKEFIESSKPISRIPDSDEFLVSFEPDDFSKLKKTELFKYIYEDKVNILKIYCNYFKNKHFDISKAEKIFNNWIEEGISINQFAFITGQDYGQWMADLEYWSNALYIAYPEFFFPYFFAKNFNKFQSVCNEYEIILPLIPQKRDRQGRVNYYVEICRVLYEFRISNDLSPEECVAFIYDFSLNSLKNKGSSQDLPEPSKVWYVGAGKDDHDFLDNASTLDSSFWQCNIDTKPGDIIIVYCWSPRSYIHSVWRAITDGFIDPFFHYYTIAYISQPIVVPPISFKEIKCNLILSKTPIIANNFQGVNGAPIGYKEYKEMLRIWQERGMNTDLLPTIKPIISLSDDIILTDERDVELYLLEPLLKRIGYDEIDWVRQMSVKMGRGVRYYPDYCFGAISKRGEESATMIIEAKYSIRNSKQIEETYLQAKSYAIRLQADKFVLASKEGIWVYEKSKGYFQSDVYTYFTWNDLENPDKLHGLSTLIGKLFSKKSTKKPPRP